MAEANKIDGKKPIEKEGIRVIHYPTAAWEYRVIPYSHDYSIINFRCIDDFCKTVIPFFADVAGKNTVGSKICHGCERKAYAMINEHWFEVG